MSKTILLILAVSAACSVACSSSPDDPDTAATASSGTAGSGGQGGGGGTGAGAGGSGGHAPLDVCPEQHDAMTGDGHAVVVCDALHPEAPFVRPPADTAAEAYVATDGRQLFARSKPARELSTDELALLGVSVTDSGVAAHRYGFAIFRASLDADGVIESAAPAVLIEDALFLGFFANKTVEGLISRHKPDPDMPNFTYEQTPTLPIRVRFGDVKQSSAQDANYDIVHQAELPATVENLSQPVLSSKAACLPALTAAGAENPFDGQASVALRGGRVPSMHAPGDNAFVIDGASSLNHMGPWMLLPHHLLLPDASTAVTKADFGGHGNPLEMPRLTLEFVDGGDGDCQ